MINNLKYSHTSFGAAFAAPKPFNTTETHATCFVLMHDQQHVFIRNKTTNTLSLAVLNPAELANFGIESNQVNCLCLGEHQGSNWKLLCIDDLKRQNIDQNSQFELHDLRLIGRYLDDHQASIAAYARALKHWHENCQFCGRCGCSTHAIRSDRARQCDNSHCQYVQFPRIDPAIIVLVTQNIDGVEHCLLGHNHRFAAGFYSALAGFVDLGENLEQAVCREVKEESGIDVIDVHYVASQPWPFPQSLMLGFYATAQNSDIVLHDNELADARWFSAEQLADFGEMGHDEKEFMLPSQTSIAYYLIKQWLKKQHNI